MQDESIREPKASELCAATDGTADDDTRPKEPVGRAGRNKECKTGNHTCIHLGKRSCTLIIEVKQAFRGDDQALLNASLKSLFDEPYVQSATTTSVLYDS
jgi:hypothetical protein